LKLKDIIKLIVSLLIIGGILAYLYLNGYFEIVKKISFADWVILIGLTFCSYLLSGIQMYYLVRHVNGTKLSFTDLVFMPMSMNMFGYLIPTNGGFLYAVYFLKKKYSLDSARGFSVGVFSIYMSFIISGIILLGAVFMLHSVSVPLIALSVVMILSPLLVFYTNKVIQRIPTRETSFAGRVKGYLNSVVLHSNKIIGDKKMVAINILLSVLSLLILFLMYYRLNHVLAIDLPLLSVIALLVMMRISGLIRLLPGNLGLEELLTAGLFGIIGHDPSVGLVFSVFLRFCAVVIMIPVGVTHTAYNSKFFSLKDLRAVLKRKSTGQEEESPAPDTISKGQYEKH
jgi:uncharacterized protein (TIRG00374 family)